jgi:cytochrome c5
MFPGVRPPTSPLLNLRRTSAFVAAAMVFVLPAGRGSASPAIDQEMQSTMNGVYSAPQAARGEETYMGVCVACHPAGTYRTAAFKASWKGRPLAELFDQVREKMPKNDPASLSPQEYIQVVAYLLRINGVPAGDAELPADSDALRKIRIEMPGEDAK